MELAGLEPATSWVRFARACHRRYRLAGRFSIADHEAISSDAFGLSAIIFDSGTSRDKCLKR